MSTRVSDLLIELSENPFRSEAFKAERKKPAKKKKKKPIRENGGG
jgi:hypothetical protein